jgi:NADH-quinone oxidoreductase subunit J
MVIIVFFALAITCTGSVLGMILSRNQGTSALFLVLGFAALGGVFGLLGAPFLAVVQVIIYAGAIMVLFIFVIMMINMGQGIAPEKKKWILALACVMGLVILAELVFAARGALPGASVAGAGVTPTELGRLLFTTYAYPFELTSILILAALTGAIVLVKKREP